MKNKNGTKGAFGRRDPVHCSAYINPEHVYHFTDTARLPWILESGMLRVDRGAIGKYPTKFVWATTLLNGDPTCTALSRNQTLESRQNGSLRLVRFTFNASDFD
jgi:hypothetical protein